MDASVLIVGAKPFCDRLLQRVQGLASRTRWQAEDAATAVSLATRHQPDLVLLEARDPANWELCHALHRYHSPLRMYCILIDDSDLGAAPSPQALLQYQARQIAKSLASGADSYLWYPLLGDKYAEPGPTSQSAQSASQGTQAGVADALEELFHAYLKVGEDRVRAYRELSQTNDLLSAIALVDALTKLGNRRAFDWEMPRQIEAARAQGDALSLLILDIDYFKTINDRYGHLVGDQVLEMFSDRLRHNMRFYETPFRYGGEEFVVLLQSANLAEGERAGERLRRLIGDVPFIIDGTQDLALTVSVGVGTLLPTDDGKGRKLLARADSHLLKAKNGGRNRVVSG